MDEEFIQIAFPKDYEQRSRLRMVAGSDKSLCGKWKVRPQSPPPMHN
jgi:hypothetical protein